METFGLLSIIPPIVAIALAYSIGGPPLVYIIIGAIFAGSVHIAHLKTQIPYALLTAGISGVLRLLSSFIQVGWLLLIGFAALVILTRVLCNRYQHKHFTEEEPELLNTNHEITT
jgi:hypothetical protein